MTGAARLRRIHYSAGWLTVSVEFLNGPWWEKRMALGLCRDTLTMVEAFERAWRAHPAGMPYHVGVVLTQLVADCCATLPLFPGQLRRNALADVMDRIDQKYGRHTVYFAGMFGAADAAPTRISFTQIPRADEF